MKTVWYKINQANKSMKENKVQKQKQFGFYKIAKAIKWGKENHFNKWCWSTYKGFRIVTTILKKKNGAKEFILHIYIQLIFDKIDQWGKRRSF